METRLQCNETREIRHPDQVSIVGALEIRRNREKDGTTKIANSAKRPRKRVVCLRFYEEIWVSNIREGLVT